MWNEGQMWVRESGMDVESVVREGGGKYQLGEEVGLWDRGREVGG
jgi:hypothetical protein